MHSTEFYCIFVLLMEELEILEGKKSKENGESKGEIERRKKDATQIIREEKRKNFIQKDWQSRSGDQSRKKNSGYEY